MDDNYKLRSNDELTLQVKKLKINSWVELTTYIYKLPYGRNKNREDLSLVLIEKKGSCSSKHAFLKKIADLNNIPDVSLVLGMYKMNQYNTPKIGNVMSENSIAFIPEAHCYLKIRGVRMDFTTNNSEFQKNEKDIIHELNIELEQVVSFKAQYHKEFLKDWIKENEVSLKFDEIWSIREQCIENLSN